MLTVYVCERLFKSLLHVCLVLYFHTSLTLASVEYLLHLHTKCLAMFTSFHNCVSGGKTKYLKSESIWDHYFLFGSRGAFKNVPNYTRYVSVAIFTFQRYYITYMTVALSSFKARKNIKLLYAPSGFRNFTLQIFTNTKLLVMWSFREFFW